MRMSKGIDLKVSLSEELWRPAERLAIGRRLDSAAVVTLTTRLAAKWCWHLQMIVHSRRGLRSSVGRLLKGYRLSQVGPHKQLSPISQSGQNVRALNVYRCQTHVEHFRPSVRFDSISRPLMSANVGKVPPDS